MDILGCMPDEVICHILSFLPTVYSVQTSVLSKRWRFLWAQVPTIVFGVYPTDCTVKSTTITEILLQHNHDIHTFILHYEDPDCREEDFESWFVNITTRNIHNITLTLDHQFMLPQCLFTCKTLIYLMLGGCDIPMSGVYFPALKKLNLDYVQYESHESLAHLISGCPVLEELNIDGEMLGPCCILSPTLTRLVLSLSFEVPGFGLKLDTPALCYLCLEIDMPHIFSVGTLDSLIEADIVLSWDERQHDKFAYSRNVLALFGKLYNVKHLSLAIDPIEMIHDSPFSALAAKFHNLTKLALVSNLGFITSLLESNDNLQVLDLAIRNMVDIDNQYYRMPKQVPACVASHLRTVIIEPFRCSEEEFDFVRYILTNAKALKKMEVRTQLPESDWEKKFEILERFALSEGGPQIHKSDWKKKFEALERLTLFERGSQECQLVFR